MERQLWSKQAQYLDEVLRKFVELNIKALLYIRRFHNRQIFDKFNFTNYGCLP